jgi:hypothetical protein
VVLRPGIVVCAEGNVPVTLCTTHPANEIAEAVIKALSGSCPDRVMGGWSRRFRISITGDNSRTGHRFIWHMFHARPAAAPRRAVTAGRGRPSGIWCVASSSAASRWPRRARTMRSTAVSADEASK